jgi:hypothetical protein
MLLRDLSAFRGRLRSLSSLIVNNVRQFLLGIYKNYIQLDF